MQSRTQGLEHPTPITEGEGEFLGIRVGKLSYTGKCSMSGQVQMDLSKMVAGEMISSVPYARIDGCVKGAGT